MENIISKVWELLKKVDPPFLRTDSIFKCRI